MPARPFRIWDNNGMAVFAEYLRSIFYKRRWTVMSATPFLAKGWNWIAGLFSSGPYAGSWWGLPLWVWVISFLACFAVAQFLAWLEQYGKANELSGMPAVSLECEFRRSQDNTVFILSNGNDFTATNLSIGTIPVRAIPDVEVALNFTFTKLAQLVKGAPGTIYHSHELTGLGAPKDFWGLLNGAWIQSVPCVLDFSNLSPNLRSWRSHYQLEVHPGRQIIATLLNVHEVVAGKKNRCALCRGQVSTQLASIEAAATAERSPATDHT
jgi:hypothetical protein